MHYLFSAFFFIQKLKNLRYIIMIILTTTENQTFSIIPVSQVDLNGNSIILEFTNETTKEVTNILAKYTKSINDVFYVSNYIVNELISNFKIRVDQDFGTFESENCLLSTLISINNVTPDTNFSILKENTFYCLKAYFNTTNVIIYKDKVFVTNQSKNTFSINNGGYALPNIDNNNYITI
jgi:hypothetical protein